jgi:starch-binding outer membrane protein, SusD/RagB family
MIIMQVLSDIKQVKYSAFINPGRYLKIILSGTFILALMSCEKIFEPGSKDYIGEDKAYSDNFSARSSVLGLYAMLQDVAKQVVVLGELQGDLVTVTENAGEDLIQINEHHVDVNNPYANPSAFFKIIVNCNEVSHKISKVLETDKTVTREELNGYLAEITIIRAWTYFTMIKIYGTSPYFEETLDELNKDSSFTLNAKTLQTEDFVIDTLLKQLNVIDTFNLNIDEASPFFTIRAKRSTIWALQGEMYLWRNEYTLAKKAYFKVITQLTAQGWPGVYRMPWINTFAYYATNWKDLFRYDLSSGNFEGQAIFIIPFSKLYNQKHDLQRMFGYGEGGDYLLRPTDYIIQSFQSQRIVTWEDQPENEPGTPGDLNRGKGVSYDSINGKPVVTKYSLFKEPFNDDACIFIYRDGDYHLGGCEAVCRLNQASNALEHLNQGKLYESPWGTGIRSRVNITSLSVTNPKDVDAVEDLILNERALELAFEGHRWFDLIRFARHKNDPSFLADKIAEKFNDPNIKEQVRIRLLDENNWFIPLKIE